MDSFYNFSSIFSYLTGNWHHKKVSNILRVGKYCKKINMICSVLSLFDILTNYLYKE